jgi:glycine reductase
MRLELGNILIKDVQLGANPGVSGGVLTVDPAKLRQVILEDDRIVEVTVEVAKPGESTRITPVKDVIEPRVKVDGGEMFPGMVGKVATVGEGRTHVLKGVAVVTCGKIVGFQEGIVDMSGPGAAYTPFSQTFNICLVLEPAEGIKPHEYEAAARMAGLRAAAYIGEFARSLTPDEVETYETKPFLSQVQAYPELPKIGYVYMLQTQGLLHDTYVYGVDAKKIVPTLVYPTEVMDGAVLSGNCVSACDKNTSYHHQNNPIIRELYKQHGKEINFLGVILTNENVFLMDKERSSDWSAKLAAYLGFDAVIISQEGFGNPDTDLIMNCKKIELQSIKTVIVTNEYAGRDGMSQSLADADPLADATVTGGNSNEVIVLPAMQRVIGTLAYTDKIAGGFDGSLRPDGSIEAEIQVITGATNELGFNKISAVEL